MPISTGTERIGNKDVHLTVISGDSDTQKISTSKGDVVVGVEKINGENKAIIVGSPDAVNEVTRKRRRRSSRPVGVYDVEKGQTRQPNPIEKAVLKKTESQPVSAPYTEAPIVDNNYLVKNKGKKEVILFQLDSQGDARQISKISHEPTNNHSHQEKLAQPDVHSHLEPAPPRSRLSRAVSFLDTKAANIISRGSSSSMEEMKVYSQQVLPILKGNTQGLKETGGIVVEQYGNFRQGSAWLMNKAIQFNVGTKKNEFKSIPEIMKSSSKKGYDDWMALGKQSVSKSDQFFPTNLQNDIGYNTSNKSLSENQLIGSHNPGMFNEFKSFFNNKVAKPVKRTYHATKYVSMGMGAEMIEQPIETLGIFKGIGLIGRAGGAVGNFFGPAVGGFANSAAKYSAIGGMGLVSRNQITDSTEKKLFTQGFLGSVFAFEGVGLGSRYVKNKAVVPAQKKINPKFVEDPGIVLKPVHTDPIAPEALVKNFGGTRQTTVHVTENPAINFRNGDLMLRGFPEEATGFRKNIDSLNFYRSLPESPGVKSEVKITHIVEGSPKGMDFGPNKPGAYLAGADTLPGGLAYPKGKPQAYLAYLSDVKPTDYPSSQVSDQFRFFKPKRQLLIEDVDVKHIPKLPGEGPLEFNQRTNTMSGKSIIPAENIYGMSVERQVTTPSAFTGVKGTEYPGSRLRFVEDVGFTYYEQPRSLGWPLNKVTPLERAYQNTALGKDMIRLDITRVKTLPVEGSVVPESFYGGRGSRVVDVSEYSSSYGRTRYVGPKELVSESLKGSVSRGLPLNRSFDVSLSESRSLSSSPINFFSYSMSESPSQSLSFGRSRSKNHSDSHSQSFSLSPSPSVSLSSSPSVSPDISPSISPSLSGSFKSDPFIPFIQSQDDVFQVKKQQKNNFFGQELMYDPSLMGIDLGVKNNKKSGPLFGFEIRGL